MSLVSYRRQEKFTKSEKKIILFSDEQLNMFPKGPSQVSALTKLGENTRVPKE